MNTPPPPCAGRSVLFDSTDLFDHLTARRTCSGCPMVAACLERALSIADERGERDHSRRGPDGTWAGLLWRSGSVVPVCVPGVTEVAA